MQPLPLFNEQAFLQKDWQKTANQIITMYNQLLSLQVKVVSQGVSKLEFGATSATLTISTKDMDLGSITGSKGSNAALTSLLASTAAHFTVRDSTS